MNHRSALAWAGILGAAGVALGAVGAHALRDTLSRTGHADVWATASTFELLHAAALVGLAAWMRAGAPSGPAAWAGRLWVAGTVLFSGSLYGFSAGGPHFLVFFPPLGGLALIAGWIALGLAARGS